MTTARIDIIADDHGSARTVQKNIAGIGKEAAAAGYSVRNLDHLLTVLGASFAIEKFAHFADEWQNIHNKLINVTTGAQNLTAVNDALFEGAKKSRTAYGEFVNVYQELAIQAERFGTSQKQMVDITTTMMEAAQLAHPSLAAMKAGVEQLILTMERGRMTTRAFSALLKDTPQLAQALADGLNIPINKLRELAHHSKLTSSEIIKGLEDAKKSVDEKFLKLTPTIEGAMTVLHNGWIKFIGDLDQSTGVIGGVTSLIIALSEHVDILAEAVVLFGSVAVLVFSQLAKRAILSMWASLVAAGPVAWAIAAILAIAGSLAIFGDKIAVTADGFVSLLDVVKGTFSALWSYIQPVLQGIWENTSKAFTPMAPAAAKSVDDTMGVFQGLLEFFLFWANATIGFYVFIYDAGKLIWEKHSDTIKTTMSDAMAVAETSLNYWFSNEIAVINLAIKGWQEYGKARAEASGAVAPKTEPFDPKTLMGQLGNLANKDILGTNYLGNLATEAMKRARGYAKARHANGGGGLGLVHGDPEDDPTDAKKKKAHIDRAKTRQELINEEMKKYGDQTADANNLDNTFLNRKAFEEVTKFNDDLQKHKDKKGHPFAAMSADEKASLYQTVMGLEAATRLQKERDAIMEAAIGPRLKYEEQEIAIGQLLQHNSITAAEAAKAERDAAIAFYSTQEDAHSGAMLGNLEIMKEMQDRAHPLADAMKGIWEAQQGPLLAYQTQLKAINQLLADQLITAKQAGVASRDAAISYLDTQTDAASGVTRALLKIQKAAEDSASHMEQFITDAFKGMEDAFASLFTGDKFDIKGFLKQLSGDAARSFFQQNIGGPLAGILQSKFGISIPGLAGKIGETQSNPMWVRSADGIAGLGGGDQGILGGFGGLNGLGGLFDIFGSMTADNQGPLSGDTTSWEESFDKFTGHLDLSLRQGSITMGNSIGSAVGALGGLLGQAIGGKAGGILGTILSVGTQIATAYFGGAGGGGGGFKADQTFFGQGGYATGGGFTVGGAGGVDSQLVQFKASPGEQVNIGRGGAKDGGTVNYYEVNVDARGSSDVSIEQRISRAMAEALPAAEKKTRTESMKDVGKRFSRQSLAGAR